MPTTTAVESPNICYFIYNYCSHNNHNNLFQDKIFKSAITIATYQYFFTTFVSCIQLKLNTDLCRYKVLVNIFTRLNMASGSQLLVKLRLEVINSQITSIIVPNKSQPTI